MKGKRNPRKQGKSRYRYDNLYDYLQALRAEDTIRNQKQLKLKAAQEENQANNITEVIPQRQFTEFDDHNQVKSYEGFTEIHLDFENREFTIKRPVKMYGVEAITMTIDTLVKRFINNWYEWTNGQEVRAQNYFDWIRNVCRRKNIFLEKVIDNEPNFRKSIQELYLGEAIFGKQSIKRSKKALLAQGNYSARLMILAPEVSVAQVKTAIQDLIELNFLVEFEIAKINQEQAAHLYSSFKHQEEKNQQMYKTAKMLVYEKFWQSPYLRGTCDRVMDLINNDDQTKLIGNQFALSALRLLTDFESLYGSLEQIPFKTRRAAENIIM